MHLLNIHVPLANLPLVMNKMDNAGWTVDIVNLGLQIPYFHFISSPFQFWIGMRLLRLCTRFLLWFLISKLISAHINYSLWEKFIEKQGLGFSFILQGHIKFHKILDPLNSSYYIICAFIPIPYFHSGHIYNYKHGDVLLNGDCGGIE